MEPGEDVDMRLGDEWKDFLDENVSIEENSTTDDDESPLIKADERYFWRHLRFCDLTDEQIAMLERWHMLPDEENWPPRDEFYI